MVPPLLLFMTNIHQANKIQLLSACSRVRPWEHSQRTTFGGQLSRHDNFCDGIHENWPSLITNLGERLSLTADPIPHWMDSEMRYAANLSDVAVRRRRHYPP